jgi:predicted DNA-binding helix-hairpin-helix protein
MKKIGVVMKRAKYFITCSGRPFERVDQQPARLHQSLLIGDGSEQQQPRQLVLPGMG